jgi:predicted acetyltransferase
MTTTVIRELHGDEALDVLYALASYAFNASPPLQDRTRWEETWRPRLGFSYVALYEDGVPVAGAAATAMTQQVRGALYGMAGLWGVATAPAARRKGYARRVLGRLLALQREAGRTTSCLYPFRESFYERLGYVAFPLSRKAQLSPLALAPLLRRDLGGEVELLPSTAGYAAYLEYMRGMRQRVHGVALLDVPDPLAAQSNLAWVALARAAGKVVGLMTYSLQGEEAGDLQMRVRRFYALTSQGRYLLLQWIARHADQASRVEIGLPPYEQPETWLSDLQLKTENARMAPMGRVLDVSRLGGMHSGPGRFSARIADPLCPWNEGLWEFESVDGTLRVSRAEEGECALGIQGLAALLYGPYDPADLPLRGWGDPSARVQDATRAMFPPLLPTLHESF